MDPVRFQLRALGYQGKYDIANTRDFRVLVLWLEEARVRFWKPDQRKSLRNVKDDEVWNTACAAYLKAVDFKGTLDGSRELRKAALTHLLMMGVVGEIHDEAAKITKAYRAFRKACQSEKNSTGESKTVQNMQTPSQSQPTSVSKEFEAAVYAFAKRLGLPTEEVGQTDRRVPVDVVLKVLRGHIERALDFAQQKPQKRGPAGSIKHAQGVKSEQKQSSDSEVLTRDQAWELVDAFPLGFRTEDKVVERVAKVLRLLHLHQLRSLQTQINEVIVRVQKFTAKPEVNSRLGRVGR